MTAPIITQIAIAMCAVALESFAPMQVAQASAWPVGEARRSASRTNEFRLHQIKRSRFIFRQNQQP